MTTEQHIYKVLVVEPNAEISVLLRSASREVRELSIKQVFRSFAPALQELETNHYDIILISAELPAKDIVPFIKSAKKTKGGEVCSYVQLAKAADLTRHSAAASMISGVDGFLFEPFSVVSFEDTLELAATLNKSRMTEREKKIINLVLVDVITWIDASSTNPFLRKRSKSHARGLAKMKESLANCVNANEELFFSEMIEKFVALAEKKRPVRATRYTGASNRVRQKYEQEGEQATKTDTDNDA